ncbi:hypothetical protein NDU88_007092 [Pleurodeles waltl]|uniref:Uncharacterized protein n=1 Tax=Pleurodeles waltl TaxID=8319 RepID=A0AAV7QLY7_PLEWA|nr:hypothetical protein NDU88_007092 [Pleurodeles waltl]
MSFWRCPGSGGSLRTDQKGLGVRLRLLAAGTPGRSRGGSAAGRGPGRGSEGSCGLWRGGGRPASRRLRRTALGSQHTLRSGLAPLLPPDSAANLDSGGSRASALSLQAAEAGSAEANQLRMVRAPGAEPVQAGRLSRKRLLPASASCFSVWLAPAPHYDMHKMAVRGRHFCKDSAEL